MKPLIGTPAMRKRASSVTAILNSLKKQNDMLKKQPKHGTSRPQTPDGTSFAQRSSNKSRPPSASPRSQERGWRWYWESQACQRPTQDETFGLLQTWPPSPPKPLCVPQTSRRRGWWRMWERAKGTSSLDPVGSQPWSRAARPSLSNQAVQSHPGWIFSSSVSVCTNRGLGSRGPHSSVDSQTGALNKSSAPTLIADAQLNRSFSSPPDHPPSLTLAPPDPRLAAARFKEGVGRDLAVLLVGLWILVTTTR